MFKHPTHRAVMPVVLATCLLLCVLAATPIAAATWHVNPDGSGDFATIGAAVGGAADGDIISLGDGTFTGAGNRDIALAGRTLVIRSLSGDPDACVIDVAEAGVPHRAFTIDGGSIRIYSVTLRGGHHGDGGAVHVTAGAPLFIDCRFRYNETTGSGAAVYAAAGADPRFSSCSFEDGVADVDGAAVLLGAGSEAEFTDCLFLNNAANRHGGAVASQASNATFDGCEFADNGAADRGGAVYVTTGGAPSFDACVIRHNFADRGGAAACTGQTSPTFTDCVVYDNHAYVGGGAFHCDVLAEPEITGCTLVYNNSDGGAGLYCANEALPRVDNTLIAFNHGAAFASDGVTTAVFHCCDLFGNWGGDWVNGIETQRWINDNLRLDPYLNDPAVTELYLTPDSPCLAVNNAACGRIGARGAGGTQPTYHVVAGQQAMLPTIQAAIDMAPDGAVVMLHGTFTGDGNRDLEFDGKLIAVDGTSPEHTVIDCQGSEAEPHRGFTYSYFDYLAAATIRNLTIRNGYQFYGGAIFFESNETSVVNVRFESCRAEYQGGAIYGYGTFTDHPILIQDCVFIDNVAGGEQPGGGGAIAIIDVLGWQIRDCEFAGNTSSIGGAIRLSYADRTEVSGCRFFDNQALGDPRRGGAISCSADDVQISACTFQANLARYGGGLLVAGEQVVVSACEFTECRADSAGGGVLATSFDSEIAFNGCVFLLNESYRGGGLATYSSGSVIANDLSFEQNSAGHRGGAFFQHADAGSVLLDGCDFDSNQVGQTIYGGGGGLWLGAEAYLADCRIETNTTGLDGRGGGIHAAPGATVGLEVCDLRGNVAAFGAGLYGEEAAVDLDSCWLRDNHATYHGGAAYFQEDSGSVVAWCTMSGNTSDYGGGAMGFGYGSTTTIQNCTLVDNGSEIQGAHLACGADSQPVVSQCILAFAPAGEAVWIEAGGSGGYSIECTDIYGNAGGNWTGAIADQLQVAGNFSADPRFCDLAADDFTLYDTSPCLPEHSDCGTLIGAWPQGCVDDGTPVPDLLPAAVALEPNVPNPFNPSTSIAFALPTAATVDLAVYDARGRCVRRLVRGEAYPAGRHEVRWDGADDAGGNVGSGVYVLRLLAGGEQKTRKAVLLK